MLLRSRQILTNYIVKRPYWTPDTNINTNVKCQCFIDYDKYVQDTYAKDKQINDIHLYYKHLNNIIAEQKQTLKQRKQTKRTKQNINSEMLLNFLEPSMNY